MHSFRSAFVDIWNTSKYENTVLAYIHLGTYRSKQCLDSSCKNQSLPHFFSFFFSSGIHYWGNTIYMLCPIIFPRIKSACAAMSARHNQRFWDEHVVFCDIVSHFMARIDKRDQLCVTLVIVRRIIWRDNYPLIYSLSWAVTFLRWLCIVGSSAMYRPW